MLKVKTWIQSHRYCLALSYFIFYGITFVLLEKWTVPKYIIHCALDDAIPFCEIFIVPYLIWFPLVAVSLGYFMFQSKEDFQNLCFLMFSGMTFCLLMYGLFPNGLALRQPMPRDNIGCLLIKGLYQIDSPTNVCPSIHVASTVAIDKVVQRSKILKNKRGIRIGSKVLKILICLSTLFIKQHSVIDVVAGIVLTECLCLLTYHYDWRRQMAKTKLAILL